MTKRNPSKSNPTWVTKTLAFISSASAEGLERVMIDINATFPNFTPEENDQVSALVVKDKIDEAAARVSAAEENGVTGYNFGDQIRACDSLPTIKRLVHAVDLRLKTLPEDQRGRVLEYVASGGDAMSALNAQMAALGVVGLADLPGRTGEDEDEIGDEF